MSDINAQSGFCADIHSNIPSSKSSQVPISIGSCAGPVIFHENPRFWCRFWDWYGKFSPLPMAGLKTKDSEVWNTCTLLVMCIDFQGLTFSRLRKRNLWPTKHAGMSACWSFILTIQHQQRNSATSSQPLTKTNTQSHFMMKIGICRKAVDGRIRRFYKTSDSILYYTTSDKT